MLVVTTENVPGHRVSEVVRSRGLGGNIMAGLRSLAGGEITEYTQLLEEARRHAVDRMVANATTMGANAIVMMRFDSSEIGQNRHDILSERERFVVSQKSRSRTASSSAAAAVARVARELRSCRSAT